MRRKVANYSAVLAVLLLAAVLAGCGSGNREGTNTLGGSALFGNVATVGDTACVQCHSATTENLTGQTIVSEYQQNSPHNQDGLGCESCHGGGAMHNGVGPIPYPKPDANRCATCHDGKTDVAGKTAPLTNSNTAFATSGHAEGDLHSSLVCNRCHTHEGAVLSDANGFTGSATIMGNTNYQAAVPSATSYNHLTCDTCHAHGGGLRVVKTRDGNGNLVNWNPSKSNKANDQFNFCTSCHNLLDNDGTTVIATGLSGTAQYGPTTGSLHYTRWNRMIASTHYNNLDNTVGGISGYVLRKSGESPCFDCHGHEAKTNTNNNPNLSSYDPTQTTIYTDWAQSGHAGGLLTAKFTAASLNAKTAVEADAVMQANTKSPAWGGDGGHNWSISTSQSCQMCHTSTGASNYLNSPTTYDPTKNDFSHLAGWKAATGSKQSEMLYCWGCHKNAGTGTLRNTSQAILSFTIQSQPIVITGTGNSTACVVCHGGRGSAGEAAASDTTRSTRFNGHHAPTAGVLYSAQTHIGYEYPGKSYANPSFFAHDKIGQNVAGPCASCHMAPSAADGKPSHTFAAVTETAGAITAINNQTLCNTCHTPGGQFEMTPAALEEEKTGYAQASTILNNWVSNIAGYANYLGYAITSSNYKNQNLSQPVSNNDYGAYQNAKLNGDEPCAYVHNRFYAKRLIFDSIDWMDNGVLDGTINIDATTYPEAAAWFNANAGVASRP